MHKWLTASVSAPVGAVAKDAELEIASDSSSSMLLLAAMMSTPFVAVKDLGHKLKRFQSNSRHVHEFSPRNFG